MPLAQLRDVQADARLSLERHLRTAPAPLAGGMRKALHKALAAQKVLRRRDSDLRRLR